MDNLRRLLGIRRMGSVLNAWIRKFCEIKNCLDERIDEGVLQWYCHEKRMERDRIAKRLCRRVC